MIERICFKKGQRKWKPPAGNTRGHRRPQVATLTPDTRSQFWRISGDWSYYSYTVSQVIVFEQRDILSDVNYTYELEQRQWLKLNGTKLLFCLTNIWNEIQLHYLVCKLDSVVAVTVLQWFACAVCQKTFFRKSS